MYYYYYEAKSFLTGDMGFTLPAGISAIVMAMSVVLGILAFALILFAAISIKRARPLGIIAALAQPVAFVSAALTFISYSKMDFSCLEMTVTSSISQSDAMNKLYEAMGEAFIENLLPQFVSCMFFAVILQVATIISLVYYILLLGAPKGKGFAITAMILTIIRFAFVAPIEYVTLLIGMGNGGIQLVWFVLFNLICCLPVLLVGIQGIPNLIAASKAKKLAAAEAPAEAPAEEA